MHNYETSDFFVKFVNTQTVTGTLAKYISCMEVWTDNGDREGPGKQA